MSRLAVQDDSPTWPRFFAVMLVCVTFPLIWVGGLVTTYDAGMAVPDWPTTYGYNMFLYPVSTWISGPWDLFIEHGHRLLGAVAGLVTIALNVAIWRHDRRIWMRWVGTAALLLVISQGLLGGMRVRMNSTDLARIHGCTGPLFFGTAVAICVLTSRFWYRANSSEHGSNVESPNALSGSVVAGSWLLVALSYCQLILGAHLRHPGVQWAPGTFRILVLFHVFAAIAIVLQAFGVASRMRRKGLRGPAATLVALVVGQFLLGIATWRAKYGWPTFLPMWNESSADQPMEISIHNALVGATVQSESMVQALTVTGHVAVGSLILATSVFLGMRAARLFAVERRPELIERPRASHELSALAVGGVS